MPKGFRCAGVSAGIKPAGVKDMALILSDPPANVAGVFTTNQVCAAPVKVCREHLAHGRGRAIVMNSGIANACTGSAGMEAAAAMAAETARLAGCDPREIYVCSTGKIGPQLPLDRIMPAIAALVESAAPEAVEDAAEAMMTTDTRPKITSAEIEIGGAAVRITGMAKGAGMIEPDMATMLAFLTTDAAIGQAPLQHALKQAVDRSFNRISVDGDQSTNDTVLLMANGAAGTPLTDEASSDWSIFTAALEKVCFDLAMMIVHDGEGADRFVTVHVKGAASVADAESAARAVANSMLNKTAWAGTKPDWGRIMDAIGYSDARVVEERVDIFYDGVQAVTGGCRSEVSPEELIKVVSQTDFAINIDLHTGEGEATVYTCSCTEEYVRINY
jgi:glutamate N-acetyltransferase/amino-acid N-acetyltransferase